MHAEPRNPRWSPALRASAGLHVAALAAAAAFPAAWPWLLGGVVANHAVLGAAGMWPRSQLLGPNLVALPPGHTARREVALTFDDGPNPAVTPAVLDLLDRHGATASFFCIGQQAAKHPDLLRDIVARGHRVENHSQTHPNSFACLLPAGLAREIGTAQTTLATLAGQAPRYFRAPMGLRNPMLQPVLARLGLHLAAWTRRGYDGVNGEADTVLQRLVTGVAAGDVLLLHDGRCGRTRDGQALVLAVLARLLERLGDLGLKGVALPVTEGQGAALDPVKAEP
ncbi:MAG TPA: polysaccharide deacetylase family protein [Acetobacteraceae bacterium]